MLKRPSFEEAPIIRAAKAVMVRPLLSEAQLSAVRQHYENSSEMTDFYRRVLADYSLILTQFYAIISKRSTDHSSRIKTMLGDYHYLSNQYHSVLIESESVSIKLPISADTERTVFAIKNRAEFNPFMMEFKGQISGNFSLYQTDSAYGKCEKLSISKPLSGCYSVYAYMGFIVVVGE